MENEDIKECFTCAGYYRCWHPVEHLQNIDRVKRGVRYCWHPKGVATIENEEEVTKNGQ
jgi:hypothetical protein